MKSLETELMQIWYQQTSSHLLNFILHPLSGLFKIVVACRQFAYRQHLFKQYQFPVPVIVVGNINIGGTGKTPLTISLCQLLQKAGFHPAIATRGYRGTVTMPTRVSLAHTAREVGDEALVLHQRTGVDVAVAKERYAAILLLLENAQNDVILLDDGLQHYAVRRDIEIAVIDGERGLGNRRLLPAGPLRETPARLNDVDYVLINGENDSIKCAHQYNFHMIIEDHIISLADPAVKLPTAKLGEKPIHLVAGLGYPDRFFQAFDKLNLPFIPHAFPDHHEFVKDDLDFGEEATIIMTEKDAVKCREFADYRHWYLPGTAVLDKNFCERFLQQVREVTRAKNQ